VLLHSIFPAPVCTGKVLRHNGAVAPVLDPDTVYLWYRDTERLDLAAVEQAEAMLSEEERARSSRFRSWHDRRDFVIAHDLLRRSLSKCYGVSPEAWAFAAGALGQPIVRAPTCHASFSISHTRGLVACAIASEMTVGVDIERVDPTFPIDEVAERHFTSQEVAALRRLSGDARAVLFCEFWTLKEAFGKALGVGLALRPDDASFERDEAGTFRLCSPATNGPRTTDYGPRTPWHFGVFAPHDRARVAVAVRGAVHDVENRRSAPTTLQTPERS